MGLPIWRDPEEKRKPVKDAVKADPTAAARSAIRRQPSIRPRRRYPVPPRSPPPHARRRQGPQQDATSSMSIVLPAPGHSHAPSPPPPLVPLSRPLSQRARLAAAETTRLETSRYRATPPDNEPRSDEQPAGGRVSGPSALHMLTGDSHWEHVGPPRLRWTQPSPDRYVPSAREDSYTARSRSLRRQPWLDRYEPPRLTRQDDTTRPQSRNGLADTPREGALPTPPLERSGSYNQSSSLRLPSPRGGWTINPVAGEMREGLHGSFSIDGLGDRRRSLSPGSPLGDVWEVIQTTITPDTTLPSADSSFTSAAASASFTSSNSNNASRTWSAPATNSSDSATSYSSQDQDADCIQDSTSELDTDNEMEFQRRMFQDWDQFRTVNAQGEEERQDYANQAIAARLTSTMSGTEHDSTGRLNSRMRQIFEEADRQLQDMGRRLAEILHSNPTLQSSNPNHDTSELSNEELADRLTGVLHSDPALTRRTRQHLNDLDTIERLDGSPNMDDSDLEQMRGILERLASRRDIPDEWWMIAGLSRTQARGVQDRRREETAAEDERASRAPAPRSRRERL